MAGWTYKSTTITGCYCTSCKVSGKYIVGGLVGYNGGEDIYNCFSNGTVTGDEEVGGFVGRHQGDIKYCYSNADVIAMENVAGGFAGYSNADDITNCYCAGNVTKQNVNTNKTFGGFAGDCLYSTIKYSYSLCNVYEAPGVPWSSGDKGFIGESERSIYKNNFFDSTLSNQYTDALKGAFARTTSEMKSSCNYLATGWDFKGESENGTNDQWTISSDNSGYPALVWQGYSNTLSLPCQPHIITDNANLISTDSVIIGGTILSTNGSPISEFGICYDTSPLPDTSDSKLMSDSDSGSFTFVIKGLTANVDYYFRAYAINNAGINYGNQIKLSIPVFDGLGTSEHPYLIENLDDLSFLCQHKSYWNNIYEQIDNINAAPTRYWDDTDDNADGDLYNDVNDSNMNGSNDGFYPIGGDPIYDISFTGKYDGLGHIIDSIYINRDSEKYIGLFGSIDGRIKNLGLTNVDITGYRFVGSLAGETKSNILNCYATGEVSAERYVGGIVGYAIFGKKINDCYSTCNVAGGYSGGIIGYAGLVIINNCYSTGNIAGGGGLIGYAERMIVNNCYSTGDVEGYDNIGGFIGLCEKTTIKNCYSHGDVLKKGLSPIYKYFGGFIGKNVNSSIENAYCTGKVLMEEDTVSPTGFRGFVGVENGNNIYKNNYYDSTVSNQDSAIGALPLASSVIKNFCEFYYLSGWDFMNEIIHDTNDYWGMNPSENNGYPFLSWQGFSHAPENIAPDLNVADKTIYLDSMGNASITAGDMVTYTNDACGLADTVLEKNSFSCSDGEHIDINVTLFDISGNKTDKKAIITISDTISPTLVTNNFTVSLSNNSDTINFSDVVISATDNCNLSDTILSKSIFTIDDLGEEFIDVTVIDEYGNETTQQVTLTITGIEDILNDQLLLYPNPTKDKIKIESGIQINRLKVMDLAGKIILDKSNIGRTGIINLAGVKNGIYIVQIQTDDNILHYKILKQ